jgi:hypothetical protein
VVEYDPRTPFADLAGSRDGQEPREVLGTPPGRTLEHRRESVEGYEGKDHARFVDDESLQRTVSVECTGARVDRGDDRVGECRCDIDGDAALGEYLVDAGGERGDEELGATAREGTVDRGATTTGLDRDVIDAGDAQALTSDDIGGGAHDALGVRDPRGRIRRHRGR